MSGDARTLILPVPIGPRGTSSWAAHQERKPKSSEPGTDIYCDTGTEVVAPADGVIYGYGESVVPATGRWVGIDFDNGMSFRCMHHSRITRKGGRVRQGDVIALSGSSGYGSEFFGEPSRNAAFWRNTGGDHTHATLWPTRDKRFGYGRDGDPNKPYTIDLMDFIRLDAPASIPKDWFDMANEEDLRKIVRDELNKRGPDATQAVQNIQFIADQANGYISPDRPREGQLANGISRITELLYSVDGLADPRIIGADGKPVMRALAAFLRSRSDAPSSGVNVNEGEIVAGVLAGLAQDREVLVAAIKALPAETIAALKAAL